MAAQYVVVALKVENIHSGWLSSGKLVAPKEDNIQIMSFMHIKSPILKKQAQLLQYPLLP